MALMVRFQFGVVLLILLQLSFSHLDYNEDIYTQISFDGGEDVGELIEMLY